MNILLWGACSRFWRGKAGRSGSRWSTSSILAIGYGSVYTPATIFPRNGRAFSEGAAISRDDWRASPSSWPQAQHWFPCRLKSVPASRQSCRWDRRTEPEAVLNSSTPPLERGACSIPRRWARSLPALGGGGVSPTWLRLPKYRRSTEWKVGWGPSTSIVTFHRKRS